MGNFYTDNDRPETGAGKYLKWEAGKPVRVRIATEPVVSESVYNEGKANENISTKYSWGVYNFDAGVAQVMSLPPGATGQIWDICSNPDWGDPLETPFNLTIKPTGEGLERKYSIIPSPSKQDLTPEMQKEVDDLDVLEAVAAGQGVQRAMWYRDAVSGNTDNAVVPGDRPAKPSGTPKDVVIEDIPDEPINLDDIPF